MSQPLKLPPPKIQVTPSLLGGDFGHLAQEAKRMADAGADALHIDVMDGHFVRNFAICARSVAAINRATDIFLDVHLMIYQPENYIEQFIEAGADRITIHFEASEATADTLLYIRRCNRQAGIAFNPETSANFVLKYLQLADLILFMTVNPGFGGQAFIPEVLDKIRFIRETCDQLHLRKGGVTAHADNPATLKLPAIDIQVDGGINFETAKRCVEAGANVLASGSWLYKPNASAEEDIKAINQLRSLQSCF
jgi:ribulose-phosphate 3-epimerase